MASFQLTIMIASFSEFKCYSYNHFVNMHTNEYKLSYLLKYFKLIAANHFSLLLLKYLQM